MSRYLRFNEHINEVYSQKEMVDKLVSAFPNHFATHSNSNRIKNLNDISAEEFEKKIKTMSEVIDTKIIYPPQSGSSRFVAVEYQLDWVGKKTKTQKLILAGGAVASKGHGFEYDLEADLKTLVSEKVFEPELYIYKNIIKDIIKLFNITEKTNLSVIPEGGGNKKRPLTVTSKGIHIGTDTNLDIGPTITDITLEVDGVPKYLSLKHGLTVQFSNTGTAQMFPIKEIKDGQIKSQTGINLLAFLGLDNETFCRVFNEHKETNFKDKHVNKKVDSKLIGNFLKEAIGYGYYMIHTGAKGKTYKFYEVNQAYMKKASKLKGGDVTIRYGGVSGKSKMIEVIFDTPVFDMTIDFRNRSGGVMPNVMGTRYKYINFGGKPIK